MEAALNLERPDATLVTRQLSHTADTDINYYQALSGSKHAATALQRMEEARAKKSEGKGKAEIAPKTTPLSAKGKGKEEMTTESTPTRKRRRFTEEEEEMITLYFEDNIQSSDTPHLEDGVVFLQNHPLERTPKNIQDKVKTIIKNE